MKFSHPSPRLLGSVWWSAVVTAFCSWVSNAEELRLYVCVCMCVHFTFLSHWGSHVSAPETIERTSEKGWLASYQEMLACRRSRSISNQSRVGGSQDYLPSKPFGGLPLPCQCSFMHFLSHSSLLSSPPSLSLVLPFCLLFSEIKYRIAYSPG